MFTFFVHSLSHPFPPGIDWETLHEQDPPKLDAYLPAITPDDKPLHAHDVRCWLLSFGVFESDDRQKADTQDRQGTKRPRDRESLYGYEAAG